MTTVIAKARRYGYEIELDGHAEGKDPRICTAISTLTSALELYCANHNVKYNVIKRSGYFKIRFSGHRKECRTLFDFVIFALYEIQHDFEGYVNVKQG